MISPDIAIRFDSNPYTVFTGYDAPNSVTQRTTSFDPSESQIPMSESINQSVSEFKFSLAYYECSPPYTATILLGSTLTLKNTVSSFTNGLLPNKSCAMNRGNPKPSTSGSADGRWKLSHDGSGTNDSATPP